jgi:hypothetical protein
MATDRKHRVTFRVAPELAAALRQLPNQTAFVESALRDALGHACPWCEGRGKLPVPALHITDFKVEGLPRVRRETALQLRALVHLARRLFATDLQLQASVERELGFRLARKGQVLLEGRVSGAAGGIAIAN